MKALLAIVFAFVSSNICSAKDIVKQAKPGQPTQMWIYLSWKKDCSPNIGVVKLMRKPQHGSLKTSQSRFENYDPSQSGKKPLVASESLRLDLG